MRVALVVLAALTASGQNPVGGKPVTGNFEGFKAENLIMKLPHVHWSPVKCKTAPDGVYGRSFRTYYGCIKGKDVCSDEKGVIPKSMIAAYDAKMREHEKNVEAFRAGVRERMAAAQQTRSTASRPVGRPTQQSLLAIPQAAPAPPVTPITEAQASEIVTGTAKADVIAKLGEPYMKITGDFENFTYLLTSGKLAKIDIESGKVTRARIVPAE